MIWVKLQCIKHIDQCGQQVTHYPGDFVKVGKHIARQWEKDGCAIVLKQNRLTVKPRQHTGAFTMFTIPMAWKGERGIKQRNAITSWRLLNPKPNIMLLYDDPGTPEAAEQYNCQYFGNLRRNKWGTPLISDTFTTGQNESKTSVVCYCNTDIILHGLGEALMQCADTFDQFLVIGRRWDVNLDREIVFSDNWQDALLEYVKNNGRLHNVSAIDYFGFRVGLYENVPDFAVGRSAWDNWLVSEAVRMDVPVIDASNVVLAVHQDMPQKGGKQPPQPGVARDAERLINRRYYDARLGKESGTVKHSTWIIDKSGLYPK